MICFGSREVWFCCGWCCRPRMIEIDWLVELIEYGFDDEGGGGGDWDDA